MTADVALPRRTLLGTSRAVSAIGISIDPATAVGPPAEAALIAQLRTARRHGVTFFDVAAARFRLRAERLIATAFPDPDPEITILVGDPREDRGGRPDRFGGGSPLRPAEPAFRELRSRLGDGASLVVETAPAQGEVERTAVRLAELDSLARTGAILGWSLSVPGEETGPFAALESLKARQLSAELSMLDPSRVAELARRAQRVPTSVFVRDPFAQGRLDGTRFSTELFRTGTPSPPVNVGTLRAEFAPVLRLGFLTASHRRTLAQAAVQYVLSKEWVAVALVPMPRPERLAEVLAAPGAPPLTEEELARIEGEGAPGPDERAPAG